MTFFFLIYLVNDLIHTTSGFQAPYIGIWARDPWGRVKLPWFSYPAYHLLIYLFTYNFCQFKYQTTDLNVNNLRFLEWLSWGPACLI